MSKQNLTLTILSLSVVVLLAANYFLTPPPAMGATTIKDRLYQVCTATTPQATDGIYILNNQTGLLTCYSFDPAARRLVSRASQSVMDLFSQQQPPGH